MSQNLSEKLQAAEEAEKIVDIQTARFMRHLRSLQAVDVIKKFRIKVDEMQQQELAWALKRLQAGHLPEEVVAQMSQRLSNKFMHFPSVGLRRASAEAGGEVFEEMERLLGL